MTTVQIIREMIYLSSSPLILVAWVLYIVLVLKIERRLNGGKQ
jgi:hypothetical protein